MYHASKSGEISSFYPWTHFGTADAAQARAAEVGATTTYPVILSIKNPLRVRDIGTTESGMWDAERLVNAIPDKQVDWNLWSGGKSGLIADAKMDDDLEVISDFLKRNGYDGIVYKNAVEDIGSDSYIAFRREQIQSAIGVDQ
jgi:hypothetical protein